MLRAQDVVRAPSRRGATYAHWATLALALAYWAWADRGMWFFGDEWDFLATRGVFHGPTNPYGIFYPHNEHWSTLPILLWRALFNLFHLGSYWPYLVPLLIAHLGVVHLVWRLALREKADPWVATGFASVLAFLGAGAEDIAWAFQIGFVGSVLAGLGAFYLLAVPAKAKAKAQRALLSPWRRDMWVAVLLLCSLMCSAAGIAMLLGAAVYVLSGRRYHQAVRALAGPACLYVTWYLVVGHQGLSSHSDQLTLSTFTNIPSYIWDGISGALGASFNFPDAGAVLLVGLLAWLVLSGPSVFGRHSLLFALSTAVVVFYVLAAVGRDNTTVSPDVSRYVYVCFALLAPVLARLATTPRPASVARPAVIGLCLFTVLGNIGQAQTWVQGRRATTEALKPQVLAAARLLGHGTRDIVGPLGQPVPADPNLSAADAARLQRAGQMPYVALSPAQLLNARAALSVSLGRQAFGTGKFYVQGSSYALRAPAGKGCTTFAPKVTSPPMVVRLHAASRTTAAVAQVITPADPAATRYLSALVRAPGGPQSTAAVQLEMAPMGRAFLSDNYTAAQLILVWGAGTSLTLCGLAKAP